MQQFFGHPESPLFGVYHAPRGGRASAGRAVLICPPIGQEYVRTHWCLRLLANQIARGGAHVLRLDYHGLGDSAGRVDQVDSLEVWRRNVRAGIEQLKSLADVDTVMLIGQRLGGTLAADVATQSPDVNSVVLWEPVLDGAVYLDALRTMHARMLDLWVCKMQTPDDDSREEILGSMYARSLLAEIEAVRLDVGQIPQPQLVVETEGSQRGLDHVEPSLQKIIYDKREPSWSDLRELESAYLRPAISRQIVKRVNDMFGRLEQFNALSLPTESVSHEVNA